MESKVDKASSRKKYLSHKIVIIIWSIAIFYYTYYLRNRDVKPSIGLRKLTIVNPQQMISQLMISQHNTFLDIEEYFNNKANVFLKDYERKRYVLDNFLSNQEIKAITSIINRSEKRFQMNRIKKKHENDHNETWFTNFLHLDDHNRTELFIARGIRRQVLKLVRYIFGDVNNANKIYVETCNFHILRSVDDQHDYHLPGITQTYSHGLHSDNCNLHYDNMSCSPFWTHSRHYTAIVYIKPAKKGGNFIFYDFDDKIQPIQDALKKVKEVVVEAVPGRIVIFDSGPKNLHAVNRMFGDSDRVSMQLWMTRNNFAREYRRRSSKKLGNGDDDT